MTTTETITARQLAQSLADAHYKIATRHDETASYMHPVYRASQRKLRMAIAQAYGPGLVNLIMEIWVDCGEPLSTCAVLANQQAMDHFQAGEARLYCDGNDGTGEGECARIPRHEGACDDGVEPIPAPRYEVTDGYAIDAAQYDAQVTTQD